MVNRCTEEKNPTIMELARKMTSEYMSIILSDLSDRSRSEYICHVRVYSNGHGITSFDFEWVLECCACEADDYHMIVRIGVFNQEHYHIDDMGIHMVASSNPVFESQHFSGGSLGARNFSEHLTQRKRVIISILSWTWVEIFGDAHNLYYGLS
jgi:hypothetical protein